MIEKMRSWLGEDDNEFSWWWLLVLPIVVLALARLFRRMEQLSGAFPMGPAQVPVTGSGDVEHTHFKSAVKESTVPEMAEFKNPAVSEEVEEDRSEEPADDFRVIEGIGPSISSILHRSGIRTYQDLADASKDKLHSILEEAGLAHLASPETWPEQAALAAKEQWDKLQELQDTLQRGRRMK